MVGLNFYLNGRRGILLADPGYHAPWVVIVMEDGISPHTGWLIQAEEYNFYRKFGYYFKKYNNYFVEWIDMTFKSEIRQH